MNRIVVRKTENNLTITINGLVHLFLNYKPGTLSFQSWIDDDEKVKYHIEYYLEDKTILTEYENKEDWREILKRI